MEERDNEYPIIYTPKGKAIEIKPDGIYGLWIINPHGINIPNYLKGTKYTTAEHGIRAVQKWIDTIGNKE